MIKVIISRDDNGVCKGFHFSGHAEYAELGQDIVCSAVSILVTNTINSIEKFTADGFSCEVDEANGDVQFAFTDEVGSESELLVESMLLGLGAIAQEYGNDFILIED